MSSSYKVLASNQRYEMIEKKSRFIAEAIKVDSRVEVEQEIKRLWELHPKARHVCYAFIAGAPGDAQNWGFSDDGEPNGTAGKPILNVLQYSGIGHILIAIVRYFGGIKLGTGGLVRAYGSSAKEVLDLCELKLFEATETYTIQCKYAFESTIRRLLDTARVSIADCVYSEDVCLSVRLTDHQLQELYSQNEERWFVLERSER